MNELFTSFQFIIGLIVTVILAFVIATDKNAFRSDSFYIRFLKAFGTLIIVVSFCLLSFRLYVSFLEPMGSMLTLTEM
jgi:hypothetical protein